MSKKFKIKISVIFTILFHKKIHLCNNLFSTSEDVFSKVINIHLYTNQKKIKIFLKKSLHIT
jgi:hypothetical protein